MASITGCDATGAPVRKGSKVRPVRYRARWRTPDGASREKWFTRKIEAETHLTSVEHRKLAGEYVDTRAGCRHGEDQLRELLGGVTRAEAVDNAQYPPTDGLIFTTDAGHPFVLVGRLPCRVRVGRGDRPYPIARPAPRRRIVANRLGFVGVGRAGGARSLVASGDLDVYTHFWPSDEDKTREAIERASAEWLPAVGQ